MSDDFLASLPNGHSTNRSGPSPDYLECQFDSIVGLTHNYAGLAYGNVASERHRTLASNPRLAARQGLEKMRQVAAWGIPQAVLPPLLRPRLDWLRELGFNGSDADVIRSAAATDPVLLAAAYSASSMWAANAATVSPALDTRDHRLHLTPANLASSIHRSLEPAGMTQVLHAMFADSRCFHVHSPLPAALAFTDEGAANHIRLAPNFSQAGLEIFVYGRNSLDSHAPQPQRFPARQTLQASQAVARRHQLNAERTLFIQQDPDVIDQGVFHNDVISVGHLNVLLTHAHAFYNHAATIAGICDSYRHQFGQELTVIEIPENILSVDQAVASYLFNSQILTRPGSNPADPALVLVCPQECRESNAAQAALQWIIDGPNPIEEVVYFDLRQSMQNGGGPACLRLRVLMNRDQQHAVSGRVWMDDALFNDLNAWVEKFYPDKLVFADLTDPELAVTSAAAHAALLEILELPELGNC